MVQIVERPDSFGSILGRGLGMGISSGISKDQERRQRMKEMSMQREQRMEEISAQRQFEREMLAEKLKGQGEQSVLAEMLKQQGREKLLNEKLGFLGKILPGEGQKTYQMQDSMGSDSEISDDTILKAMMIDPNMGRALQAQRDFQEKRRERSPEFQREQQLTKSQAQSDVKYNTELQAAAKQHELKSKTLERLEKLNRQGVTGKPYEKLLEKSGLVALTSDGRREFAADVKNLITDIRSILGSQFSQFEFQTILNAYPSADFSKGANQAIIDNLNNFQKIRAKEFEFAKELKKRNGGKLPADFQSQVNDMVQEYAASILPDIKSNTTKIMNEQYGIKPGHILLFDTKGEPLSVPYERMQEAIQMGATEP